MNVILTLSDTDRKITLPFSTLTEDHDNEEKELLKLVRGKMFPK